MAAYGGSMAARSGEMYQHGARQPGIIIAKTAVAASMASAYENNGKHQRNVTVAYVL